MITLQIPPVSSKKQAAGVGGTQVRAASEELFAAGAIATLSDEPRPVLVGEMQWVDDAELLLFTAHGDTRADAHRIRFDEAIVNPSGSVTFLRDHHVAGMLQHIDDADVDDPDDYHIAWQLWQEVAPLRRGFVERCFEALLENQE